MPPLSRSSGGVQAPMSAGDWGRQAMPAMQPSFTAAPQVARAPVQQVNSEFAQKYAKTENPDRPYQDIGKQTLNLTKPGAFAANLPGAGGFVEGFGAGAGRAIGGLFGQAQLGADIGRGIGHIPQVGLDAVGGLLGAIPAIPGLPGGGSIPGASLLGMNDAQRKEFLDQWDGNPFGLMKALGDYDKEEWNRKIESGEVSPILRSLGPADNLGEQVMNTLGIFGIPSDLIQRGWAGGPGEAIDRVMNAPEEELNPEVLALRERFRNKEINQDKFLDELVVNGAGYSNNWVVNLLGSGLLDPANLAFGAGTAIGLSAKGAKAAQAIRFVDDLGREGVEALARQVAERSATEGGALIAKEAVTPLQVMEEAVRVGSHGDAIANAARSLPARQQIALKPGFARLEKIADISSKVLDPTNMIGARGSKPLTNAFLSREGTKGIAQGYGIENYSRLGDALDSIGKGDLFDEGIGYFGAQEGLLMAGDSLADDVASIRRIGDARPTKIAEARAKVGAQNYAMKMEKWVARRKADLAMLSGGTKEEAMARAHNHALDRLTRSGLSGDEAAMVLRKLGDNEDAYSLVDAMYFGNRIKGYNTAKRGARERLAAEIANNEDGLPTVAQQARMETVDRATLIGPRELTDLRAKALREALDTGDIEAVRAAVRKYDALAVGFLADGTEEAVLLRGVKEWLDEFEPTLTKELDDESLGRLPRELAEDARRGDGYTYGLRPANGEDEWRLTFHDEDDLANGIKAGDIKSARPWTDIVGDRAETWNLRFRDDGGRVQSFANALERKSRRMGQQITSDKIDREARRRFVEGAMSRKALTEGGQTLTYSEGRDLYDAVKRKALDASVAPRGMNIDEFASIVEGNKAASRVMSARDLQLLSLQAFEGNVGTVGLTQKLSGKVKTNLSDVPLMPSNAIGQVAERMYPLIRFSLNPVFQMQEWVEPWVFSAARGRAARLTGKWTNPLTGEEVTLDDVQMIQQHMIERYKASSPEAQFDMMERSLVYLHGAKAAKQAAAAVDRNVLRRAIGNVATLNVHERKAAAQSEMFRYFLGPMLKEQFDQINPNIWLDLEKTFGTKDQGQIAVRWLVEKDKWASSDPRVAYHLMDASKEPAMGARAAVNLEENAHVVFNTSREALNHRVTVGEITHADFVDTMRELGAHQDYIDRTWKATQFEVKTGGVDKWWDDAVPLVAGGKPEVDAARSIVRALAETEGISETELLSRTLQSSPVSLLHDDLIDASEETLAAWGTLLQQSKAAAMAYGVDPVTGATVRNSVWKPMADMDFLKAAQTPPQDLPLDQVGAIDDIRKVTFGEGGRDIFIPGGIESLNDLEKPFTLWEAHVIRAQMIDPMDLKDPALKHALYEKMWRAHQVDMADPENTFRLFNNSVMAMLSAGLNLTRNELISTRFRVGSMQDLRSMAAQTKGLRATIEDALPEGQKASHGDLGLAYSTNADVAHYIPLDDRLRYMGDHMLPARQVLDEETGLMKDVKSTAALVEERAQAAQGYLGGTSRARRDIHGKLDELQDAHKRTLKGDAKKKYKPPGRIQNWAIEELGDAIQNGVMVEGKRVVGLDAIDALIAKHPMFGTKRAALFKDDEIKAITEAAGKLAEDPLDLEARAVLQKFTGGAKKMDDNVIFKPWNVNGAGLPAGKNVDSTTMFHGDHEMFAYLKNDDVSWRGFSTNTGMGRALTMAEDMVDNPQHFVRRADESLDEFAERMSHRTDGLSLKTAYFGVDLGDPVNFERGVMDTHMVGDLTEHMYFDLGENGTNQAWKDFYASLSPDKQAEIDGWLARDWKMIPDPKDPTGNKTMRAPLDPADRPPRGAGAYDWSEASGIPISFKNGSPAMDAALKNGDHATVAAWMRDKVAKAVANPKSKITQTEADRLLKMYRTDEELASIYGREATVLGADYRIYDDLMTTRKTAETANDPTLARHGNGGYQWKLWDDRRHVYDPEASAFAAAHTLPRRSVRYMASSDDAHFAAGFMDKGGLKSVDKAGYSYLDPHRTMMFQKDKRRIRGATILTDAGDAIIGLTQYRDRSTFLHEITHAVIEPLISDPSMKRVVWDDLNRVIDERNATMFARTTELRTQLDDITNVVADRQNVVIEAQTATKTAKGDLDTAAKGLRDAEAKAADLSAKVTEQTGALKQLVKDAPAKRKAAQSQRFASDQKRGLERVEAGLKREQEKLDALIKSRDEATAAVEPARVAHQNSTELHTALSEHLDLSQKELKARQAEGAAIRKEYDEVATKAPEARKTGWDREASEHLADEFGKWLATGEAKNPKMRDAFAYFRKALIRIFEWAKKNPNAKISPEMEQLFNDLTMPIQKEREVLANAVPFDATDEMMHAAGIQSVIDAEDASFTNVQFRRGRSWMERSINHPYLGMYPASYMWGKVAPEMVRALSVNPFGLPIPGLTKPVKIGGGEYGLHGSPFYGFVNAARVQNSVEMQKDTDPEFAAAVNDPKNDKVFRNIMMFLPASPWDAPANFPLWSRRVAEFGAETIDEPLKADGTPKEFNMAKTGSEVVSYAFGPKAGFDWVDDMAKAIHAPVFGGEGEDAITPQALNLSFEGATPVEDRLKGAADQLQQQLPQPPQP